MTEQGSFERVYNHAFSLLVRIAYRITGDMTVSEDLCQEAFIRYYRRVVPLPSEEQAKYWLIRVVRNLALNYEKRKQRERKAINRLGHEPKPVLRSGEAEVLRSESSMLVQAAIKRLPFNQRIALVLREYGNMSYKEIAKTLKISESNVKVRVYRARMQLKDYLDEGEVYVS